MIFVTVGTDHHPFDRLVREVDRLKRGGLIQEEVFIQAGTSEYLPKSCSFVQLLPFDKLLDYLERARIVISHGGPGSIMPVLYQGKVPVVIPRRRSFGEAVDDHQVFFARKLAEEEKVLFVEDADKLERILADYDQLVQNMVRGQEAERMQRDRVSQFVHALDLLCEELLKQ